MWFPVHEYVMVAQLYMYI